MHIAARNLLKAWKSLDTSKPPFMLDGDGDIETKCHSYKNYKEFINDPNYGICDSSKFHTGLLPVPYSGNILRAKAFILALNPGFSPTDYYEETFDKVVIEKRKQRLKTFSANEDFPWLSLNPEFAWTGGYNYWTRRLHPVILHVKEKRNVSYTEALKYLSQNIAVLEMVPYHSKSFKLDDKILDKMKSVRLMKAFVKNYLLPLAQKDKIVIIVTRKTKYWDLTNHKNIIIYDNNEARSASLGLKSKGGKAILRILK